MAVTERRRVVVDDTELATRIGSRIRAARRRAGLTQQQLAGGRYTKAYISALENGHAKPSVAALHFVAERLGLPAAHFLAGADARWSRLEADVLLASGEWERAVDAYGSLAERAKDPVSRADLLRGHAEALCRLGRGLEAIRPATEALDLFDVAQREHDSILAGYWLAYGLYLSDNPAEARSILRMLLDRIRAGVQVEPDLNMRLLTAAAYVETWEGKHQAAVAYLEEARALGRDLDDRRRAAFLSAVASAHYESGDIEGAVRAGNHSLALYRAAEAEHEAALVANNLANAYLAIGNLTMASDLAAEAHREHDSLANRRELAGVLDTEARISLARGDVDTAMLLASQASDAAQAAGNRKALIDARVTMARAAVQAGSQDTAIELYEGAAELLRAHPQPMRLAEVLGELAELVAGRGDHERAYTLMREAASGADVNHKLTLR